MTQSARAESGSRDETTEVITTDVCIIGAGPAGMTVALELADTELDVVILEGGGASSDDPGGPVYHVIPGEPCTVGPDEERRFYVGGNTNYWYGNCRPLDRADFEARGWLGMGGWPVDLDELEPYYRRAQTLLGLGDLGLYDVDRITPLLTFSPVEVCNDVLETRIEQTTPIFGFGELHASRLRRCDRVRMITNTRATELVQSADGRRTVAVHAVARDGTRSIVEASTVVLAAGGVENASLLLRSTRSDPAGVGNASDQVGRCFMEHLCFGFSSDESGIDSSPVRNRLRLYDVGVGSRESALKRRDVIDDTLVWGQLVLAEEAARRAGSPPLAIFFHRDETLPAGLQALRDLLRQVRARSVPRGVWWRLLMIAREPIATLGFLRWKLLGRGQPSNELVMIVQPEHTPDPENRIELGDEVDEFGLPVAVLTLRIRPDELAAHARALELVAAELGCDGKRLADGLRRKYADADFAFYFHHMGTTRMSDDPAGGVVDAACRVHGVENLYVTGSSVFPSGGTAAPTLTIVALAARLGRHLADEWGAGVSGAREAVD